MYLEELKVGDEFESRNEKKAVVSGTKRVLVGAGARALFYPTLLYNVVRNSIQSDFRWWDKIDEVYIRLNFQSFIFVCLRLVYTCL